MLTAALILRDLGMLLYGGPLIAFTILITSTRYTHAAPWNFIRSYQAWGVGLGLSLGLSIFGMLTAYWLEHGAFVWGWQTAEQQQTLALWLTFLVMWVSNIKLEVWTLEPLRKLDQGGTITDEAAYLKQTGRLLRHMWLHSALITAVVVQRTILSS